MPQLIKHGEAIVETKNGECHIHLTLDLNINLNTTSTGDQPATVTATVRPKPQIEPEKVYDIPDFSVPLGRVKFGKKEVGE